MVAIHLVPPAVPRRVAVSRTWSASARRPSVTRTFAGAAPVRSRARSAPCPSREDRGGLGIQPELILQGLPRRDGLDQRREGAEPPRRSAVALGGRYDGEHLVPLCVTGDSRHMVPAAFGLPRLR